MNDVFRILRQIESTSSRNAKKSILAQHKDNETLKKFFLYAYNERWIYGIGQKSIRKYSDVKPQTAAPQSNIRQLSLFGATTSRTYSGYTNIFDLLDELRLHPYGSSADANAVNSFLGNCDEEGYYWYTKLILKDLKIGCTSTTINEVWDNYIPVFDVMLAHPYEDHKHKVVPGMEFQLQQKLNGYRFVTFHHSDGSLQFFTRNGVELFNFPEIEEDFKHIKPQCITMVYDGEAQAKLSFNETQKYMMRDGAKTGIVYNVFDVITIDEFEREESFDKLFTRYDLLKTFVPNDLSFIQVVPELYRGTDLSMMTYWFNYAKTQGWEGIMLKLNMPYVRKRTWWMLKIKEMKEIDLECTGVNPGKPGTENEHTLGSITVDFNGVPVNVSGFTRGDRDYYWTHPEAIIGKTITVQYFEETINENNKPSLQFPQFVGVRTDK